MGGYNWVASTIGSFVQYIESDPGDTCAIYTATATDIVPVAPLLGLEIATPCIVDPHIRGEHQRIKRRHER